ncbi:hypothetical protein chiPu_0033997, partial [Chiloscyllium punctatum]|nr:hypothetical protein [Chiloscyllium punctatum]
DELVRDVGAYDLADHGNLPRTRLMSREAAAFERHRAVGDAWRRNHLRGHRPQAGERELIDLARRIDTGGIHGIGHAPRHQMRDELAGREDVLGGVLQSLLGMAKQTERNRRRLVPQHVEETERRRVDDTVSGPCRHPCDRSRGNGRSKDLVADVRSKLAHIEEHPGL